MDLGPDILRQLAVLRGGHHSDDDNTDNDDDNRDLRPPPPPISAGPNERTLQRLLSQSPVPWDEVMDRLGTHPAEASVYGYHNQSPLQRSLMEEDPPIPLEAVRAFIDAHPQSKKDVDEEGRSALYYAAYYKREGQIVEALMDACPEMIKRATDMGTLPLHVAYTEATAQHLVDAYQDVVKMRDSDGEIPLHGAASWGESGSVRVLIEAGRRCYVGGQSGASGALVVDKRGKTPLDRCCELIVATSERVGQDLVWGAGRGGGLRQSFVYRRLPMDGNTALRELEGEEAVDMWHKLEFLAMEAITGVLNDMPTDNKTIPLLHACVALTLPPEVIWHCANMYREQVTNAPDTRGRLPLHFAAKTIIQRRNEDNGTNDASEVIDILLSSSIFGSNKSAAITDLDNRMPLHYAAEAGAEYDEGIEALVRVCPRSLEERDARTGLFPFALAASTSSSTFASIETHGDSSVDTIYRLLREAPSVLESSSYD
mmetsp:Transcript_23745/g.68269  ORF Transcript_23745/g.68269 Transcript_23745/m.68269 type:complete len:485 (-) Transcript_23745:90-1544(-)